MTTAGEEGHCNEGRYPRQYRRRRLRLPCCRLGLCHGLMNRCVGAAGAAGAAGDVPPSCVGVGFGFGPYEY